MARRRDEITPPWVRVAITLFIISLPACGSSENSPGTVARQFAIAYFKEGRDSTIFELTSGLASTKLQFEWPHPRSDGGMRAFLADSLMDGSRQVFMFRLIEPGGAVLAGEPRRFEVVVDTRAPRIVDYRFR